MSDLPDPPPPSEPFPPFDTVNRGLSFEPSAAFVLLLVLIWSLFFWS